MQPSHISSYMEQTTGSNPTVQQHLVLVSIYCMLLTINTDLLCCRVVHGFVVGKVKSPSSVLLGL